MSIQINVYWPHHVYKEYNIPLLTPEETIPGTERGNFVVSHSIQSLGFASRFSLIVIIVWINAIKVSLNNNVFQQSNFINGFQQSIVNNEGANKSTHYLNLHSARPFVKALTNQAGVGPPASHGRPQLWDLTESRSRVDVQVSAPAHRR